METLFSSENKVDAVMQSLIPSTRGVQVLTSTTDSKFYGFIIHTLNGDADEYYRLVS